MRDRTNKFCFAFSAAIGGVIGRLNTRPSRPSVDRRVMSPIPVDATVSGAQTLARRHRRPEAGPDCTALSRFTGTTKTNPQEHVVHNGRHIRNSREPCYSLSGPRNGIALDVLLQERCDKVAGPAPVLTGGAFGTRSSPDYADPWHLDHRHCRPPALTNRWPGWPGFPSCFGSADGV
jgi:hypothetical protein